MILPVVTSSPGARPSKAGSDSSTRVRWASAWAGPPRTFDPTAVDHLAVPGQRHLGPRERLEQGGAVVVRHGSLRPTTSAPWRPKQAAQSGSLNPPGVGRPDELEAGREPCRRGEELGRVVRRAEGRGQPEHHLGLGPQLREPQRHRRVAVRCVDQRPVPDASPHRRLDAVRLPQRPVGEPDLAADRLPAVRATHGLDVREHLVGGREIEGRVLVGERRDLLAVVVDGEQPARDVFDAPTGAARAQVWSFEPPVMWCTCFVSSRI